MQDKSKGQTNIIHSARRYHTIANTIARIMKLNASTALFALAVAAATNPALALKENCVEQLPLTIYEAAEMSPQNMDYDMENNVSTYK